MHSHHSPRDKENDMAHSRIRIALAGTLGLALVIPLALASSESPAEATSAKAPTTNAATAGQSTDFQNLNGFMWYYSTYFGYKYTDIEKDLDSLKSRGIRVLAFFNPYNGDKNTCDGCSPLDFYSVPPQNGTIQDWKRLVAAAHHKGMKVVSYFTNLYMDEKSEFRGLAAVCGARRRHKRATGVTRQSGITRLVRPTFCKISESHSWR